MAWYIDPAKRWWLRVIGAAVLLAALRGGTMLVALVHAAPGDASAGICLLAAATFCGASVGVALTTTGHHVFDRVEISERWARRNADRRCRAAEPYEKHMQARLNRPRNHMRALSCRE